jgi:hypothetical protein
MTAILILVAGIMIGLTVWPLLWAVAWEQANRHKSLAFDESVRRRVREVRREVRAGRR